MKNKISKTKKLQKENEKLREALVDALMPLHCTYTLYGRAGIKSEVVSQAKRALKKAQEALDFEFWEMADITNTDEDLWEEEFEERLDVFFGSKDDDEDD